MCHTSTKYHISNAHSSYHTRWRIVKSFSFKVGSRSPCSSPHLWQKLPLTPETRPASWTPSNIVPTPPALVQKIPTAHPLLSTIPSPHLSPSIPSEARWESRKQISILSTSETSSVKTRQKPPTLPEATFVSIWIPVDLQSDQKAHLSITRTSAWNLDSNRLLDQRLITRGESHDGRSRSHAGDRNARWWSSHVCSQKVKRGKCLYSIWFFYSVLDYTLWCHLSLVFIFHFQINYSGDVFMVSFKGLSLRLFIVNPVKLISKTNRHRYPPCQFDTQRIPFQSDLVEPNQNLLQLGKYQILQLHILHLWLLVAYCGFQWS